ncbi:TetR/AcrR family transcriptional regulator [Nocardia miyunensis]|uniref:TetR/AcrR family transcriptional regulator n=1 Tax=Nocardia miyunensis TaxID=282684 RepID=UPI00082F5235|nr:TetR/AcrR family transcriptional regulator [Nocardia miyunensis]
MKREEQILKAAEDLFYERGFHGVGVAELGKRAGVTGSAIYRHFGSKDEILGVLFDHAADLILMNVGQPLPDPHQDLEVLVRAHVRFAAENYKLAALWALDVRSLSGSYLRSFRRRQRLYTDRWAACLDRCYPGNTREDLITAIRGVWALLMSDSWHPRSGTASPDFERILADIALTGLASLRVTDSAHAD